MQWRIPREDPGAGEAGSKRDEGEREEDFGIMKSDVWTEVLDRRPTMGECPGIGPMRPVCERQPANETVAAARSAAALSKSRANSGGNSLSGIP